MDTYNLSDTAILKDLGHRLKQLRLRCDLSQEQLSKATMLSLNAIKAAELGKCKLSTVVSILRELGALEQLDSFIPVPTVSPLQVAKRKGQVRQRASKAKPTNTNPDDSW